MQTETAAAVTAPASGRWDVNAEYVKGGSAQFIMMNHPMQNTPCHSWWMRSDQSADGRNSDIIQRVKRLKTGTTFKRRITFVICGRAIIWRGSGKRKKYSLMLQMANGSVGR